MEQCGATELSKWLKGKAIGAQSNITQRNSLKEVRRIVVKKDWSHSQRNMT